MEQAVSALYRAMLAHDLTALDALLAETCVYIHSTGVVEDKTAFVAGVRDGLYEYERVRPELQHIVVSGEMAMVYAILDFIGGPRGVSHPPTRLITARWSGNASLAPGA